ncbi:YphA family membrane protein [Lederbergia citrea]
MLYLFIVWSIWIICTFIMEKNLPYRWTIAAIALILIILQPTAITIFSMTISGPALLLILICYYSVSKLKMSKQVYVFFTVLALMVGYAGFLLFEMYDPVWMIIDRRIMVSFLLFLISYLISSSSLSTRVIVVVLGTLQGELLFAASLNRLDMPYLIGSKEYLDILATTTISLIIGNYIYKLYTLPKLNREKKISH